MILTFMAIAAWAQNQDDGCKALPATSPEHINALANTGMALSRTRKYDAAAECYRKVLAIDPNIPQIQLNLGLAEFKAGAFSDAIAPLKAAVALDPKDFQARTMLGMACFGARMYRDAATNLEMAVAEQPDNVPLRFNLAQSLVFSSQFDRALKQFEVLRKLAPDSVAIHVLLAEAYDGLSRQDEAVAELQEAVAKAPSEPNLHFGIGYLYWAQHEDDEAEREFQIEAQRDPANPQPLAWLADIQIRRNDFAKARPLLDKALALDPHLRIAHLDLAIVLAENKEYDRAIAEFKEAIRMEPDRPDAHYRLSRVYKQAGKPAEANEELAIVRQLREKKDDSLMKVSGKPAANP
jgi:tetratricopeptide (TPR) repeat protein